MKSLSAPPNDVAAAADLATLIKTYRVAAGLSQQMLAERALISVQAVSALERGYRKVPYRNTLDRIADALNLSQEARGALELSARRARGTRIAEHEAPPPSHNLPRQLTSFLGRDEVVGEVTRLVENAPLVSIVGTGGAGKTRLTVEAGARLLNRFPDGVWFVELAPLSDPSLVAQALAAALHVQESPQRPILETLIAYLAQKRLLIILDNCEHVIGHARSLVGSLLPEAPFLSFMVTSREALRISGERVYRIPPLSIPPKDVLAPEEAMKYGAVALFADRVRATDSRFSVTRENVEPVVEICRRLDGLPLALELAAARASVLSPTQICERLDRVFDLLTGNGTAAFPRHQTMRAVIDWSYGLLSSQARLLFDRLAIFAGGFTLDTATALCSDERLPREDILELLSSLVTQSLVMVDFARGDARYHLLEATRQYALEKLAERGERQPLAHRHALAFLDVAERLDRDWYTAPERSWFREAQAEVDNFRTALRHALGEQNDVRAGRLLAAATARVWYSTSPVEGRRYVRSAIDCCDEATPNDVVARLFLADAMLSGSLGEFKAALLSAEQALRNSSGLDESQLARVKVTAGGALGALGRGAEGEVFLEEALETACRIDNRRLQALALGNLGTARSRRGDIPGARRFYAEALAYYVALGLEQPAASIAGSLAEVEFAGGDAAAALQCAEEALAGHEATQNRRSVANDLANMSAYLVALDSFDDARSCARQALAALGDVKQTVLTAFVLQHLAAVGALQKYPDKRSAHEGRERAAMLLGFVDARLKSLEAQREYTERQEYERVSAALEISVGTRLREAMALGAEWTEDGAVAVALEL